jgi:hypothetical protein
MVNSIQLCTLQELHLLPTVIRAPFLPQGQRRVQPLLVTDPNSVSLVRPITVKRATFSISAGAKTATRDRPNLSWEQFDPS